MRHKNIFLITSFLFNSILLTGCKKSPDSGEVFTVTETGEVHPVADINVLYFGSGIKKDYSEWRDNLKKEHEKFISKVKLESDDKYGSSAESVGELWLG